MVGAAALVALSAGGAPLSRTGAGLAHAQGRWPERPVKLVVPFPPGGNSDVLGRVLADRLRELLQVSVVVENKPGGTTQLGTEQVARAEPDGYTWLLGAATSFTVLPHLRKLPYDPIGGFEIAGGVADYVAIVTVRKDLGVKTLPEFIALARSQPGKLTYGSAGNASAGHIYGETIKRQTGIDMLHVPFKGSMDALAGLLAGQIDLIIDGVGLGAARNGRAIALATFFGTRHPELPDVPALPETGLGIVMQAGGWGVMAPRGTPRAAVERMAAALERIVAEPDTRDKLLRASVVAGWIPADEYRRGLDSSRAYYGELLRAIGMRQEG
jgi:tripartite-type tricarboxylate transporter receptor subunit TctC